jgi:biopolymer transport protein ExbD
MGNTAESKPGDMTGKHRNATELIRNANANGFSLTMAFVVFAFLACCMTTMGDHQHGSSSIDLPKVFHPTFVGGLTWGANRHDAMIVAVARDGSVFMKNEKVPSSVLSAKIHQCLAERAEPKVYLRVDARARYRGVKEVLDAVQSSGVRDVVFLADQRKVTR